MRLREQLALLDGPIEVVFRPLPIAGDLRISWGISKILLILGSSRAGQASFQKLHFLAHASSTETLRREAIILLRDASAALIPSTRVEPWVNRATNFAIGLGFVDATPGHAVRITDPGREAYDEIMGQTDVLGEEKAFMADVRRLATERNINRVLWLDTAR